MSIKKQIHEDTFCKEIDTDVIKTILLMMGNDCPHEYGLGKARMECGNVKCIDCWSKEVGVNISIKELYD